MAKALKKRITDAYIANIQCTGKTGYKILNKYVNGSEVPRATLRGCLNYMCRCTPEQLNEMLNKLNIDIIHE